MVFCDWSLGFYPRRNQLALSDWLSLQQGELVIDDWSLSLGSWRIKLVIDDQDSAISDLTVTLN